MGFELERILYETEDFLRHHVAAAKTHERRLKRLAGNLLRRAKRAGFVLVALLVLLVAYSLLVAPIGFLTWIVAIPTAFLLAFLSLFLPVRSRTRAIGAEAGRNMPLDELAARVQDGLLDRCGELPRHALPSANRVLDRLKALQPCLADLDPAATLAGDARRLIGQHLPRLIDCYLALPDRDRRPEAEASRRFAESLEIVAGELDHLLEQASRDRHTSFETQRRFIETRYRDGPG